MLYYLTLTWNPESTDQAAFATQKKLELLHRKEPNWQVALDTHGMIVLYHIVGENILYDIHRLPDEKGVIIGKLFKRSYINEHSVEHIPDPVVFDQALTNRVISSGGRTLIEDFWGGYIAFLSSPTSNERWVLRDPTGEFPCQQTRVGNADVYFVRLEDFDQLQPPKLTLNTHFLTGFLIYRTFCRRETGVNEIETLLPGECSYHRRESKDILTYWNAIEISQDQPIYDFKEAVYQARYTLRSCVHAWASCFDGIVLSLSGGLDSSIVLTCLADAPNKPKILCRNYFSVDAPNADERHYARAVADKLGQKIVHVPTSEELDSTFDPTRIRSMYPSGWPIDINEQLDADQCLRNDGFFAEFYGHGGDELFCRRATLPLAADQAWQFGINRKLLETVSSDARINSSSYWRLIRTSISYGSRKRKWHMRNIYRGSHPSLIKSNVFQSALDDQSHWHPLYQKAADIPPVKFEHCFLLTYGLARAHSGLSTAYPLGARSPLKSQPLLELCLKIFMPIHQHMGVDRAAARRAFSHDLPRSITFRNTKAHGTQKIKNLLERKSDEVRSQLIEGRLMQLDLLDRDAVIECLRSEPSAVPAETLQICDLMSIEQWLRRFP